MVKIDKLLIGTGLVAVSTPLAILGLATPIIGDELLAGIVALKGITMIVDAV